MTNEQPAPPPGGHVVYESAEDTIGYIAVVLIPAVLLLAFSASQGSVGWSLLFGVITIIASLGVWMAWHDTKRWTPLAVTFPVWPLALGSSTSVEITRTSRKAVPDEDFEIEVSITCEEAATYTVGTDTRTDKEKVYKLARPVVGSMRNNVFTARFDVEIPVDRGGPTLNLSDNKVTWELKIDIDEISTFQSHEKIELVVSSELDARWRNIQDAAAEEA